MKSCPPVIVVCETGLSPHSPPKPSLSTMHGFESLHCHLVVKATKLHLIHRDDSPTHRPLTTVCSRVCLASPCLNTENKAGHTAKTKPLHTQWKPFNCSVVFCRLPLVPRWALSHRAVLCCASVGLHSLESEPTRV